MPTCEKCNYNEPEQFDFLEEQRQFITFYSRGERKHHTICVKCYYNGRDPYERPRRQRAQPDHVMLAVTMGGGNEPVEM